MSVTRLLVMVDDGGGCVRYCLRLSSCTYARHTCLDIAIFCSFVERTFRHFIYWPARRYRQAKILRARDMQVCRSHAHAPKNERTGVSSKLFCNSLNLLGRNSLAKHGIQIEERFVPRVGVMLGNRTPMHLKPTTFVPYKNRYLSFLKQIVL